MAWRLLYSYFEMSRSFAILFLLTLGLQGCPPVGTSVVGPSPSSPASPAAGPTEAKKEEPAAVEPTDIAATDVPANSPRGLETNLPLPGFDPTGNSTGSAALTSVSFFFEDKRSYTALPDNGLKTEIEGYFYNKKGDAQPLSCCEGQTVLVKENTANSCVVAKVGTNGLFRFAHLSSQRPSFTYFFSKPGTSVAEGPQDCDAVFDAFRLGLLFDFVGWDICNEKLPAPGESVAYDAAFQPATTWQCPPPLPVVAPVYDLKLDPIFRAKNLPTFRLPD